MSGTCMVNLQKEGVSKLAVTKRNVIKLLSQLETVLVHYMQVVIGDEHERADIVGSDVKG